WYNRQEGRVEARDFRPLARRLHKLAHVGGQERNVFARPVLQNEIESASRANALDGGGGECECDGAWHDGKFFAQMRFNGFIALFRLGALAPILQGYPEGRTVGIPRKTQQAETSYCGAAFNSRSSQHYILDLSANGHCTVQRSGIRKLHVNVQISLIFFGQ